MEVPNSGGGTPAAINDVSDYLAHDEWEVGLLEELGDVHRFPLNFWESLATAAGLIRLKRSAARCHWRCYESRNGIIRPDLTLRPASGSRRQTPLSGAGVVRPMWSIGNRTPTSEEAVNIARLWVEFNPALGPGECSSVPLAPLGPSQWRHLQPGQTIEEQEHSMRMTKNRPPYAAPTPGAATCASSMKAGGAGTR
ncbi:hypothetical protein ABZT03_08285 [Streptomyces sp. NPDC005574]|uniref:hypothetical protein n=1 Tax=Streptomyces sp. NPDC005574 TaxID=3156891 RepID=UPI00339EFFE6